MAKAGRLFFLGSFAAFALVILLSSQPPQLRDYPDWSFQGVLLAKALTGHPVSAYALRTYPVPNSVTTIGLGLLTLAFGWMWAAKIWLVMSLALAAGTSLYAGRVLGVRDGAFWWVLPGLVFFGQTFWFATVSFGIGICLLLVLACLLYEGGDRLGRIGGLLLLLFFVHLIIYAAAVVLIALYCVQRGRWRLAYVAVATMPLVAWYFAGRALTHSRESDLGQSPMSHLAVTAIVAGALLGFTLLRREWPMSRLVGPVLLVLPAFVIAGALVSSLLPGGVAARLSGPIVLLQLKATEPFDLFGFVNIVYRPVGGDVRSSTLYLLGRPLFLLAMALDVAVGLAVMLAAVRRLKARQDDGLRFLWDFAALFALLYLVCPPNAMGVIGIDMRLAQLAFVPVLFLLGREGSRALRVVCVPAVLLMLLSLYQFRESQARFAIPATQARLPRTLAYFCSVDPISIAEEYDRLRENRLEGHIFATGMFAPRD